MPIKGRIFILSVGLPVSCQWWLLTKCFWWCTWAMSFQRWRYFGYQLWRWVLAPIYSFQWLVIKYISFRCAFKICLNRFKLLFADLNVTAKKWRFYNGNKIQSSGWAPYWKVAEARLYSDYACRNEIDLTATSFTATEKDHYQCSDASKAFDGVAEEGSHLVGKCESRWGPDDGNRNPEMSWFGIDFDAPVAIGCVQFYQFTDYCQERIHVKYQDLLMKAGKHSKW